MILHLPNNHIAVKVIDGVDVVHKNGYIYQGPYSIRIPLPPGSWATVCLKSKVTEEQATGIVEKLRDQWGFDGYKNYNPQTELEINVDTAIQSFHSLCKSLGMDGEFVILKKQ